jgi:hypothetical protein
MPSAAITLIRSRIGDMGLPGVVWPVFDEHSAEIVAFYDRTKAEAYAGLQTGRFVAERPINVKDAFDRG